MAKKKLKVEKLRADRGTFEALKHSSYVEIETSVAGLKALRNVTADPLSTYLKRKQVTSSQYQAGHLFGEHYDRAQMGPRYAMMQISADKQGASTIGAQEGMVRARGEVLAALKFIGKPLSLVVEHVIGHGLTAGTWDGVKHSKRSSEDGLAALRLGLEGLKDYYRM